jgi:hypothetical protein
MCEIVRHAHSQCCCGGGTARGIRMWRGWGHQRTNAGLYIVTSLPVSSWYRRTTEAPARPGMSHPFSKMNVLGICVLDESLGGPQAATKGLSKTKNKAAEKANCNRLDSMLSLSPRISGVVPATANRLYAIC